MPRSSRRELALDVAAVCLSGSLRQFAQAQTARSKTRPPSARDGGRPSAAKDARSQFSGGYR